MGLHPGVVQQFAEESGQRHGEQHSQESPVGESAGHGMLAVMTHIETTNKAVKP